MRFKSLPWDFLKTHPQLVKKRNGFYTFTCFDPYITQLLKSHLPKGFKSLWGKELTIVWLENNILTLNLFDNEEPFWIYEAELISTDVKNFIIEQQFNPGNRYFVMAFSKEDNFRKKIIEKIKGTHLEIEMPKFWHMDRLLGFMAQEMSCKFSDDAISHIIDTVEPNSGEYFRVLNMLRLTFAENELITRKQIIPLLNKSKLDKFAFASLFGKKKQRLFYENLLGIHSDFEDLRSFFNFMQIHILKLIDPTYMEKKKSLSKYDREIKSLSASWSKKDLRDELRFFSQLEIMAKQKKQELVDILRCQQIKNFTLR